VVQDDVVHVVALLGAAELHLVGVRADVDRDRAGAPPQDLLLTTLTLVIFEYGMLVMAYRLPTKERSWMITRRSVRPMKPVPVPTAS
jgi:hypothetical protein